MVARRIASVRVVVNACPWAARRNRLIQRAASKRKGTLMRLVFGLMIAAILGLVIGCSKTKQSPMDNHKSLNETEARVSQAPSNLTSETKPQTTPKQADFKYEQSKTTWLSPSPKKAFKFAKFEKITKVVVTSRSEESRTIENAEQIH